MPERLERVRSRGNAADGVVSPMQHQFRLEVGRKHFVLTSTTIPPVDSLITVHKNFSDDGTEMQVRIIDHEWRLDDTIVEDGEDRTARLSLTLRTRKA